MPDLNLTFLSDGGQAASSVMDRLEAFMDPARVSLDLAIYDLNLSPDLQARLTACLGSAGERGVEVRVVYNQVRPPRDLYPAPPRTDPSQLAGMPGQARAIPGWPDLMHHKYVVRDAAAVWTGSTNWSTDSWTREENVLLELPSPGLAAQYRRDFEDLWTGGSVEKSGHFDPEWTTVSFEARDIRCRPIFSPGRGRLMAHVIAERLKFARRRVRIASPVLTSGPILAALCELEPALDVRLVYDRTQMAQALRQWSADPHASWKGGAFTSLLTHLHSASKLSTPYVPGSVHDYMHAKIAVIDDAVVTGSFNLSHSGEMNAENVVELEDPGLADRFAAFVDQVFERYSAPSQPTTSGTG